MGQLDQPDVDLTEHKSYLTDEDKEQVRKDWSSIPMRGQNKGIATVGLDFSSMEKKEGQLYCPKCGEFKNCKLVGSTDPNNKPDKLVCSDCNTFMDFIKSKRMNG